MSLARKVIGAVTMSLVVVLGGAAIFTIVAARNMSHDQEAEAAELVATSVTEAMRVFGIIGDMDALDSFVASMREKPAMADVRAVRAPVVVAEFGERQGGAAADEVEQSVLASGEPQTVIDRSAHTYRCVEPLVAVASCLDCHDHSKVGDVLGVASVTLRTDAADKALAALSWETVGSGLLAIVVCALVLITIIKRLVMRPVTATCDRLLEDMEDLTRAASDLGETSRQMIDGANDQAASLQQTSASLETMASQTQANARSAGSAQDRAHVALDSARESQQAMHAMASAIGAIKTASDQTVHILKTIDEIAFQTNLLALNAAVEAARAGDAGKGFAVVAEEVRTLAQRSAKAAQETSQLIETSQTSAEQGVRASDDVGRILEGIAATIDETVTLMSEVVSASAEQATGIAQIKDAVAQIDRVSQNNARIAAGSEETSGLVGDLGAGLLHKAQDLASVVGHGQQGYALANLEKS